MINQKKSILIFGAGISGLLIALEFCKKGYEVKILEKYLMFLIQKIIHPKCT